MATTKEELIKKLEAQYGFVLVKKDVQEILKISESTLDLMRKKGQIAFVKVGGQVRFSTETIANILDGE